MSIHLTISCPISKEQVDENTTRIIAALVIIVTSVSLYFEIYHLLILNVIDFELRAFNQREYSPLRFIAKLIGNILHIKPKLINSAPKVFSAGVGLVFSIAIYLQAIAGIAFGANFTGAVLIFCAFLESAFGCCVGCYVYTWFVLPFQKNNRPSLKE